MTAKHFKKVTDVKSKLDYQNKIISIDNSIQATYDRIYELEMELKQGHGKRDFTNEESAVNFKGANFDLYMAKKKTEAMRNLYLDLEGQLKVMQ